MENNFFILDIHLHGYTVACLGQSSTDTIIGRAKRAPHWGVQSRFQVIYICRSVGRYVCRVPKCVGGITCAHAKKSFLAVKTDL